LHPETDEAKETRLLQAPHPKRVGGFSRRFPLITGQSPDSGDGFSLASCYASPDRSKRLPEGGGILKAIRQRSYIFAAAAGIGVAVSVVVFACGRTAPEIRTQVLLTVSLPAGACMAALWVQECRKLRIARLIAENQILHIRTAVVSDGADDIEVFVSYFGILLDSRVIKFNQEGTFLKAVEIGRDYISLTYGTDKRVQSTRLLHAAIDDKEVDRIAEKFRHETGIVPVITK